VLQHFAQGSGGRGHREYPSGSLGKYQYSKCRTDIGRAECPGPGTYQYPTKVSLLKASLGALFPAPLINHLAKEALEW